MKGKRKRKKEKEKIANSITRRTRKPTGKGQEEARRR